MLLTFRNVGEHFLLVVLEFISKVRNQAVVICRHGFKLFDKFTNGFLMGLHMLCQRVPVSFNLSELMHSFSRS